MKRALTLLLLTGGLLTQAQALKYPKAKKSNQVDNYHGTKVSDPYRWLEDDNSAETKAWVDEENKVTNQYLAQIPFRDKIKNRLTQIWNYERLSTPYKKAGMYFTFYNNGLQNQSVLYVQKNLIEPREELLDPNKLSAEGTTSLSGWAVSKAGKYLAYGISKAGSDWIEIHVMDIALKRELKDKIQWVKFSGISWYKNGFYYSRYDVPEEGKALTKKNTGHKVYYHVVGREQLDDKLVYEDKEHPDWNFGVNVTDDENYMYLTVSESTSGNKLWIRPTAGNEAWVKVVDDFNSDVSVVGNGGDEFYVLHNINTPKRALVRVSLKKPEKESWTMIIPQKAYLLESVHECNGKFLVNYLRDATSRLYFYDTLGKELSEIKLNGLCKVDAITSDKKEKEAFYASYTYTAPPVIFKVNADKNVADEFFKPKIDFKSEDYETKQVFFASKDGTSIPMFITAKKGIKQDGSNPCFVFGYGGFDIALTPEFRTDRAIFLEAGGIYCVPNLRGGGEYGEEWHKKGTKCNKQNVFDDFIAACDYMVTEKYTTHDKIAIHGRSNGGLLIGAVMTERPDIAKVAVPTVGVLDMLRFHLFTIGRAWCVDYGCSENKEEFDCLYKYSPLHNIKKTTYPATLILTGDHDDRVVPAHSFKFGATLQENQTGKEPILIRIDKNAGHGAGKPTSKQIEEFADMWSFVFYKLGMSM
jgi:prolyl oligopeptidase